MPESTLQEPEDPIKDRVVCCRQIPLRWRKLDEPQGETQWLASQNDNARLMEVLVGGEDAAWDAEQQPDKEIMKEIRKLDAKLNLMMGWVGRLTLQQMSTGAFRRVCLSAQGLQFQSGFPGDSPVAVSVNDDLFMELFLEPHYPQAFTAAAKVVRVDARTQFADVTARFTHLSELNQQWLEKYVFQWHRRQIALSRKQSGT